MLVAATSSLTMVHNYSLKHKEKYMTNLGKKYLDRHADERLIVYWLRRHPDKIERILRKLAKEVEK